MTLKFGHEKLTQFAENLVDDKGYVNMLPFEFLQVAQSLTLLNDLTSLRGKILEATGTKTLSDITSSHLDAIKNLKNVVKDNSKFKQVQGFFSIVDQLSTKAGKGEDVSSALQELVKSIETREPSDDPVSVSAGFTVGGRNKLLQNTRAQILSQLAKAGHFEKKAN